MQLEVITITKDRLVPGGSLACPIVVAVHQCIAHLATGTRAENNQAFVVLLEKLVIHARFVVFALQLGLAGQRHEVLIPLVIHGEDD